MKRLAMMWVRDGDEAWVRVKVIGQNVGGQLHVETLGAYYQSKVRAWVERKDVMLAESFWTRLKRRWAHRLWRWAFAISPDEERKG